jgi:hypothetical protein
MINNSIITEEEKEEYIDEETGEVPSYCVTNWEKLENPLLTKKFFPSVISLINPTEDSSF